MLSLVALRLIRLLRRWSAGSINKFSEEMHLPVETLQVAVSELAAKNFILTEDMQENCTDQNQMLEITESGRKYLEDLDGKIETFPKNDKA